jgi:hypothetical protein
MFLPNLTHSIFSKTELQCRISRTEEAVARRYVRALSSRRLRIRDWLSDSTNPSTARLSHAWNSTPTKWYPIPIALGAAVLLAVQYKRSPFAFGAKEDQAVVESEGEGGARVKMKSSGPWQVSAS